MASSGKIASLSDTSSDDEPSQITSSSRKRQHYREDDGHTNFAHSPNKRQFYQEDDGELIPHRSTVIVSPPTNTMGGFSFNATSSSQDSGSSGEENIDLDDIHAIHRKFIKPKKAAAPVIDAKAKKMMAKMGFKEGTGLGKHAQGMVQPIQVSKQRGRRGLGMQVIGLEPEEVDWDPSRETVEVEENVIWLPSCNMPTLHMSELQTWLVEGKRKLTIEDETTFCNEDVLLQVIQCKSIFDKLEPEELRRARTRSNPFETIRGAFFLNRAAMKMGNIDAVFDFMFTDPKHPDGSPVLSSGDLLYFADVCAGPGGFSEYVLWRKKWEAKGFGFTLKGSNDFKLEDFHAAPSESFEPHYGVNGVDGDGDVYNPNNIATFRRYVLSQTDGKGVHFMMADGGFSVEGQENIQEILSKQLYLCQFLVALAIVRTGGHFVCKLFDVFTPFSAGLIYLMYRSFNEVCIHKPNTSRPANSERYIICKWKREDVEDVEAYFVEINHRLCKLGSTSTSDINEIVPLSILKEDSDFYQYLFESNNTLGMRQVVNLAKIAAFCKDTTLREDRQSELRKQSLEFWNIPDKARTAPPRIGAMDKSKEILGNNSSVLNDKPITIDEMGVLEEHVKSAYDWRCVVMALETDNPMQTFFLGLGRNNVFRWESSRSRWQKVSEKIELARDTLIYGELVSELKGEGRSQKRSHALHIIDAIYLGGIDVSHFHLKDRYEKCRKYAKSLNKPSRTDLVTIRVKESFKLEDIPLIFKRLSQRMVKNSGCQERIVFNVEDEDQRVYLPSGLLLYKATKNPWMLALSKTSGKKYWFNVKSRNSVYECPKDSITSSCECHTTRLLWSWKNILAGARKPEEVTRDEFFQFINNLTSR